MQPFFVCALERKLKAMFICGSASRADNPLVSALGSAACPVNLPEKGPVRMALLPVLTALLFLSALVMPAAQASEKPGKGHSDKKGDHERARAAVQAGQVLPLPILLERLQRTHPGQVLELELDRENGRWVYELRLLQANGHLLKLEVDAGTAQVLEVRRREGDKPQPAEASQRESSKGSSK
jgi:uncharacterized membrane protein YkoI